ncbi:hypothetical protein C8R43DRAFT_985933 [Mycena crocata]|nr:hypothetical protein C8R43DRAFT_985933 [Mycena crocata]
MYFCSPRPFIVPYNLSFLSQCFTAVFLLQERSYPIAQPTIPLHSIRFTAGTAPLRLRVLARRFVHNGDGVVLKPFGRPHPFSLSGVHIPSSLLKSISQNWKGGPPRGLVTYSDDLNFSGQWRRPGREMRITGGTSSPKIHPSYVTVEDAIPLNARRLYVYGLAAVEMYATASSAASVSPLLRVRTRAWEYFPISMSSSPAVTSVGQPVQVSADKSSCEGGFMMVGCQNSSTKSWQIPVSFGSLRSCFP